MGLPIPDGGDGRRPLAERQVALLRAELWKAIDGGFCVFRCSLVFWNALWRAVDAPLLYRVLVPFRASTSHIATNNVACAMVTEFPEKKG